MAHLRSGRKLSRRCVVQHSRVKSRSHPSGSNVSFRRQRTFAARQRMIDAIAASRVSNPVFIGGDIHSYWTTDIKADFSNPASATVATEFVGTSITSDPPARDLILSVLPENPHVRYFESRYRGYVVVDLTLDRMETRFQVISDRRDPGATISTLKRFVVESDKPGVVAE